MRVQALYQFYLDYRLPRGEGWDQWDGGIRLQAPTFLAIVRPRLIGEPLYPNEADQSLAEMKLSLRPLDDVEVTVGRRVRDDCIDRLTVAIVYELPDAQPDWEAEIRRALDRAAEAANAFLIKCRVVGALPRVQPIRRHWRPQDGKFYTLAPYTSSWFNDETGEKLPVAPGGTNSISSSGAIPSPQTGAISVAQFAAAATQGIEPDLVESLLVDAEEFLMTLRPREAVLALATACEVATSVYARNRMPVPDAELKKLLRSKGPYGSMSFAERRFHALPQHLDRRSFRLDHAVEYAAIDVLYGERNQLMHEGTLPDPSAGVTRADLQREYYGYLAAVRASVVWFGRLVATATSQA
jgi:hypothetical protein